jgi:hypothetical protein
VYICTNGMFMRKKMRNTWRAITPPRGAEADRSAGAESHHRKEAAEIRKGKNDGRPGIKPTKWMYWNVHVDGLEYIHDLIVEREGVFKECVEAIKMAKILGYQVATNTRFTKRPIWRNREDVRVPLVLGVDGHTISPGYEYDAAKKDMIKRLNKQPEDFFLTRKMTRENSRTSSTGARNTPFSARRFIWNSSPASATCTCTAWAIPTRNVRGWKAPCYLMTDGHYAVSGDAGEGDWDKYGVVDGVARDPRCENCMVHCGYEPTAVTRHRQATGRYVEAHPLQLRAQARARSGCVSRGCLQRRHDGPRTLDRPARFRAAEHRTRAGQTRSDRRCRRRNQRPWQRRLLQLSSRKRRFRKRREP